MTGRTPAGDGVPTGGPHSDLTTTNHRKAGWPWYGAPVDCTDYDEATWYACRKSSGGVMPRQDLDRWVQRQRASRDVWAFLGR